jgi:hypothetical protein
MNTVLDYSCAKARTFFLKEESYFNFDLPTYFMFGRVIQNVSKKLEGKRLSDFYISVRDPKTKKLKPCCPCDYEGVNYRFLNNKDGRFAWRPFQLIHPALYVSLVHRITEKENWNLIVRRFRRFQKNPKIECLGIPFESSTSSSDKAATILHWWQSIEQKSVELAMDYEYVLHTDISECYGSIYTHTVPWALHTKPVAKKSRTDYSLIGNVIDKHLRDMSFGQTNGIPQGSALMDLIAEMVLGYADLLLSRRIRNSGVKDYHILRYRDDYRIFSNNPQDAHVIAKHITEVLMDLGLRLNAQKTMASDNVVEVSIKPDKLFWMFNQSGGRNLQQRLLLLHSLSSRFPNSGSLNKGLTAFYQRINAVSKTHETIHVLISILVDIAYRNPRTYPIAAAILSKLLAMTKSAATRRNMLAKIRGRFEKLPNTGYLQIWLQRVTIKYWRNRSYDESLCKKVNDPSFPIWNSDWLNAGLKGTIDRTAIVSEKVITDIDKVIAPKEVLLFEAKKTYP